MAFISLPQGIGVPIADTATELGVRVTDTGILLITDMDSAGLLFVREATSDHVTELS